MDGTAGFDAGDGATRTDARAGADGGGDPACSDSLASSLVVEGPQGIMIQAHTFGDLCLLERGLDHICRAHRSGAGAIRDLVFTDVVAAGSDGRPSEAIAEDVLDRVLDRRDCFGNVFFGTIPEVILADPYGASIRDPDQRWAWLNAARRARDALVSYLERRAPDLIWHWYVSYEANLNFFTESAYRDAYVALLLQHVTDLKAAHDTSAVFWSPTFWTDPGALSSGQRSTLQDSIADFFTRVPSITWVAVQDHVGVSATFSCTDALTYYRLVEAAAPSLASVQLNVEYFDLTAGGIRDGDPVELAQRVRCYLDGGANLGASFELRYWYASHGHE